MTEYDEDRQHRFKSALNPIQHSKKNDSGKSNIRCNNCGHHERRGWCPGDICPKCGSDQFFPAVHITRGFRITRSVFIVVALLAIVFFNYKTFQKVRGPQALYDEKLVCSPDDLVFEKRVPLDTEFPVSCKKWHWGRKTAWPAYECDRGHIFGWYLPKEIWNTPYFTPEFFKKGKFLKCNICGSENVRKLTVNVKRDE